MSRDELKGVLPQENSGRCVWCGLPLVGMVCGACFPPSTPSRDFMIQQAVLTAAEQLYPFTLALEGWQSLHDRMHDLARNEFQEAEDFRKRVVSAFNVLRGDSA